MKKYLIALMMALMLSACATWKPEGTTVVQQQYIIRIPPAETMQLPPAVKNIDPDSIDQGEVARWLAAKEEYTSALEGKLREIAKFFVNEQKKLDDEAKKAK